MDWRDRIIVDPRVRHGQGVHQGHQRDGVLRVGQSRRGETPEQIAADYRLAPEDIKAVLLYAAELAKKRFLPLGVGRSR